jgi:hypothetical protein
MTINRDKEVRMWELADSLANSGRFRHWRQIEWELKDRGYSRARRLLDDEEVRERLDSLCASARTAHVEP